MGQRENVPLKIQKNGYLSLGGNSICYILLKSEPEGEKWTTVFRMDISHLTQRGAIFTPITQGYICIIIGVFQEAGSKEQ